MPTWIGHWLRDARLLLASQVLIVLSTTALAIILARSLGPADWGVLSALLGVSIALSVFIDVGLGTWLLRELSLLQGNEPDTAVRHRETSRRIVGGVLATFTFGTALLIGSAAVVLSIGVEGDTAVALLGLIAYTVSVAAANCLEAFLRAERRLRLVVAATIVEKVLLLVFVGAVVVLGYGIWAIGLAYFAAGICRLSLIGLTVFGYQRLPVVVPAFHHVRRFVQSGVPFAFNTVAMNVIPRLDTLLIALVSATAAGYFALGDRIVGPILIVPVVATTALYPFLARELSSKVAWRISFGMLVLGFAAAVAGALAAPTLVPLLFGASYDDAIPTVRIMLFVVPFVYAASPLLAHLYTSGRERQVLAATLIASALGTAAIVIGAVTFGALGAAVAYVFRYSILATALAATAYRHRKPDASTEPVDGITGTIDSTPNWVAGKLAREND